MIFPRSVYIETHPGGGATMRRKPAALRNIGIDLHAQALASFCCGYDMTLVHGCAWRFLETLTVRSVCGDPPYLWETRKSDRRYLHDDTDTDNAVMIVAIRLLSMMSGGSPGAVYPYR